jgi:hypothetical protein
MDPISIYHMGRIRQQEILEWAAKNRGGKSAKQVLTDLGRWLIRAGQRMRASSDSAFEAQPTSPQITVECC